jgi:hypothetical protein
MKTVLSFLAGAAVVGCLCAASASQQKWEIRAYTGGVVGSESRTDNLVTSLLPDDSEVIGSSIIRDGAIDRVVLIYRIPKK